MKVKLRIRRGVKFAGRRRARVWLKQIERGLIESTARTHHAAMGDLIAYGSSIICFPSTGGDPYPLLFRREDNWNRRVVKK